MKLGDFGLSRYIEEEDYYKGEEDILATALPLEGSLKPKSRKKKAVVQCLKVFGSPGNKLCFWIFGICLP